jgi:hypothetical protein
LARRKNFRLGGPTSCFCNDARRDTSEATLYKTKRGSYSVPVPYSYFGAFPKNSTTIAYQALLAQNLFLYPDNGPVFAVSPETGRALCISHYLVSEMNAQKLSQTFTELSTQALRWRETYFLEEELLPVEWHLAKLKRR